MGWGGWAIVGVAREWAEGGGGARSAVMGCLGSKRMVDTAGTPPHALAAHSLAQPCV